MDESICWTKMPEAALRSGNTRERALAQKLFEERL